MSALRKPCAPLIRRSLENPDNLINRNAFISDKRVLSLTRGERGRVRGNGLECNKFPCVYIGFQKRGV